MIHALKLRNEIERKVMSCNADCVKCPVDHRQICLDKGKELIVSSNVNVLRLNTLSIGETAVMSSLMNDPGCISTIAGIARVLMIQLAVDGKLPDKTQMTVAAVKRLLEANPPIDMLRKLMPPTVLDSLSPEVIKLLPPELFDDPGQAPEIPVTI